MFARRIRRILRGLKFLENPSANDKNFWKRIRVVADWTRNNYRFWMKKNGTLFRRFSDYKTDECAPIKNINRNINRLASLDLQSEIIFSSMKFPLKLFDSLSHKSYTRRDRKSSFDRNKNRYSNIDHSKKFVVEIIFFGVRQITFDFAWMKFNFIRCFHLYERKMKKFQIRYVKKKN